MFSSSKTNVFDCLELVAELKSPATENKKLHAV